MANTTYFGWETPDDTDLVKDGAAAIRTLGQAIDTSLQDLEGGTTGQILSKNSNTDMDFVWVTNDVGDITAVVAGTGLSGGGSSGSVTLTNTVATEFDAKGDLVVGTGADTFDKLSAGTNDHRLVAASGETTGLKYVADTQNTVVDAEGDLLVGDAADTLQRLAVGTTGQILTVDTTVDGKIKWAAPSSSGGITLIQESVASANTAIDFNSISGSYKQLLLVWTGIQHSTTGSGFAIRLNSDSGSNYKNLSTSQTADNTPESRINSNDSIIAANSTSVSPLGFSADAAGLVNNATGSLLIDNYASSTKLKFYSGGWSFWNGSAIKQAVFFNGIYDSQTAITSINIFRTAGSATISNSSNTSIRLYGIS
jgi:hypothetical protein